MTMCITIASIETKPQRSIVITTEGLRLGCFTDKIAKFQLQVGGTYNIETTEKQMGNITLTNIVSAKRVTTGLPDRPVGQTSKAAPTSSNGSSYYRPTSPEDSERMFVCSLMNAFIQAGKIEPEQTRVIRAIEVLRAAYQHTFGSDGVQHMEAAE